MEGEESEKGEENQWQGRRCEVEMQVEPPVEPEVEVEAELEQEVREAERETILVRATQLVAAVRGCDRRHRRRRSMAARRFQEHPPAKAWVRSPPPPVHLPPGRGNSVERRFSRVALRLRPPPRPRMKNEPTELSAAAVCSA